VESENLFSLNVGSCVTINETPEMSATSPTCVQSVQSIQLNAGTYTHIS